MYKNKIAVFLCLLMSFSGVNAEASAAANGNLLNSMPMPFLILLMGIMYFFMIRPQNKKAKEHKKLISELTIGDEVLTVGGVLGSISKINDAFLKITVADGVEITVQRNAISSALPKGTIKSIK